MNCLLLAKITERSAIQFLLYGYGRLCKEIYRSLFKIHVRENAQVTKTRSFDVCFFAGSVTCWFKFYF